jgi:adenine-specific DNA-methyltransferase
VQPNYHLGEPIVPHLRRVRRLRQESSDAERLLWKHLRGRQLSGLKFRRQHEFGPYILDFFCAERSLAVEVDGGQHYGDETVAYDRQRTEFLSNNGMRVLRLTNLEAAPDRSRAGGDPRGRALPSP